nr:addiction module antidote protein [Nesterenkonia alba]
MSETLTKNELSLEKPGFSKYDAADYIEDADDALGYFLGSLEENGDHPELIVAALDAIARSGNLSELARRVGMSRQGLYKALSGEGQPTFETIHRIAKALGFRIRLEPIPAEEQ